MILGIMQPYFFPYLGYFQLMLAVERWVVFDIVQYNRKSWMNRNRMLGPNGGWQYLSVPVHARRGALIKDATVVDRSAALRRILGQIEHYRGKAPYFSDVRALVEEVFVTTRSDRIRDLNLRSLMLVCSYLGLSFNWLLCSEMALSLPHNDHPGQWALDISSALGAARYVNLPGGRDIFRPAEWNDRSIELRFLSPGVFRYATGPYVYQENLSILDVLMWNNPSAVMAHMNDTLNVSV